MQVLADRMSTPLFDGWESSLQDAGVTMWEKKAYRIASVAMRSGCSRSLFQILLVMFGEKMTFRWKNIVLTILGFCVLAYVLWFFRSWNLQIGDGEFCCKQTTGDAPFAVTLSRATLSYILYRTMFFSLHPLINWWVEDIIALSSCAAGVVFFLALYRLAKNSTRSLFEQWLIILFPPSTLIIQIFCGHIEFYSWTCALLMVCSYFAWLTIQKGYSTWWPSAFMALATAFHSSGVFYFPTLLLLLSLSTERSNTYQITITEAKRILLFMILFIVTALLHRYYLPYMLVAPFGILVFIFLPAQWKNFLKPGWPIYLPWFVLFSIRAWFNLRAEPLIEHLPPVFEPYDHGAYLYEAFSWDHLYDKTMFHFWLAPFGLVCLLIFGWKYKKAILQDKWLVFLLHFSFWALVWTVLFYPQLRTRDWDLFASMSIPLNLFAVYACIRFLNPRFLRWIMPLMILAHLVISLPIVIDNSNVFEDRGYVKVVYKPHPPKNRAFLRGLELGITPLEQPNIRSGWAEIRIVPLERGLQSWVIHRDLIPSNDYLFDPVLQESTAHPPVPE